MADISWLAKEAKTLHALFTSFFYSLGLVLLLIGIVTEYFKITVGGMPQFLHLAGRFLIAAMLLTAYPDISNLIAEVFDSIANQIGSLNSIKPVLSAYWEKLKQLQLSWTSVKDSILMLISFVTFFLLYISVYIADAAITYAWILLYVFSPIMIALYVHPASAGATKALFRSLFEIGAWKVVWSVLATLLWSSALSQINDPHNNVNFITAVSLNLILAASLLMTPFVVNALAGAGLASLAAQTAGTAAAAGFFSPGQLLTKFTKKQSTDIKKENKGEGDSSESGFGWTNFGNHSKQFSNKFMNSPSRKTKTETEKNSTGKRTTKTQSGSSTIAGTSQAIQSAPSIKVERWKQKPSAQENSGATVSFKAAVASYRPPANRSEYQKKPVQKSLFEDAKKSRGKKS